MASIRIPLNSRKYPGLFALIDEEDYDLVSSHVWRPQNRGHCFYARSNSGPFMHRLILNPPDGYIIDHANHNGLDNRRCNIRIVTPKENNRNTRPHFGSSSRFKNVTRCRGSRWRSTGSIDGVRVTLGNFVSEELAARVADRYHRQTHGEFAVLNFPEQAISDSYLDEWIELDKVYSEQLRRERLKGNKNWRGK